MWPGHLVAAWMQTLRGGAGWISVLCSAARTVELCLRTGFPLLLFLPTTGSSLIFGLPWSFCLFWFPHHHDFCSHITSVYSGSLLYPVALLWAANQTWFLQLILDSSYIFLSLFFFSFFFRASPVAYGNSQARGQIGAAAAGLHYSHSNMTSKPCLQPATQLTAIPDP